MEYKQRKQIRSFGETSICLQFVNSFGINPGFWQIIFLSNPWRMKGKHSAILAVHLSAMLMNFIDMVEGCDLDV
ncbi:MAG: hypothetical protein PUP93_23540 [Rhizonema sp. NSF051]|nr:hypothetical protein [Rhizonema sp. NSF051]